MLYITPWKQSRTTRQPAPSADFFGRFNETIERLFGDRRQAPAPGYQWGSNLTENDKEVLVAFDAPGFEASEFDIQVHEEVVHVTAEHRVKEGEEERVARVFDRKFTLPSQVDFDKVEAKYRNGVLELRFPKAELPKPRKIAVQSA